VAEEDISKFQDSLKDLVAKLKSDRKALGYIQGILKAVSLGYATTVSRLQGG
jgi:hypothetical protein